ncbi:MAG: alpha-amylase [Bacteroidetes bacterium]|nr:alpha-amylase [Bacteroidota bacterium]
MKNLRLFIFCMMCAAFTLYSCTNNERKTDFPTKSSVYGLASIVNLNTDTTSIYLGDFFPDIAVIDSVQCSLNFSSSFDKKNAKLILWSKSKEIPALSELKVFVKHTSYSILLKKSGKIKKTVYFNPQKKKYSKIQIAGEFNNWNPTSSNFVFENGKWRKDLFLDQGTYQYQLVVDEKWILDPANPDSSDNNIGGYNSLLKVYNFSAGTPPYLYTNSFKNERINIGNINADSLFVLWQNFRLAAKFINKSDSFCNITIPEEANKMERSFIRVFSCNKKGCSNDLLIPLKFGKVINEATALTRKDLEAQVMYFLMVDRFMNKDSANDKPIKDPDVSAKANYMGGDFSGIISKIRDGYFSDLGINSLWISPVNLNPDKAYREYPEPHRKFSGYHGYWPISSTKVDYRFGTDLELLNLVRDAHRYGINVILDYVANHVHENHPLYKQHPEWVTALVLPDGRKNIRLWEEQRLTTWFDTFLPTLDFSKPEVVETMTDSALYWIKTYNIDGFRHDATKHIPENYWRRLTQKIKNDITIPYNKNFYQIGETYGSRELTGSYVNSGELDAQFDFNLFFDMRSVLLNNNESFAKLQNSITSSLDYYGYHNLMGNITGNHDMARFISYASGALSSKEDDKEAGWKRNIGVKDPVGYKKLSMFTALVMTLPGIPVLYYGDEFGMPGAGDPDNRRMMKFTKLDSYEVETKNIAKKLIKLRRNLIPLIYGDYLAIPANVDKNIYKTKDIFVFARCYFDKIAIVILNKNSSVEKIKFKIPVRYDKLKLLLKSNFENRFDLKGDEITISLEGNAFEIITN